MTTTAMPPRIDATWVEQPCDENRTYGGPEAADLAGVTYRQLDYWLKMGLLDNYTAPRSGGRRRFTLEDLEIIHAAGALVTHGFTVEAALALAPDLANTGRIERTAGGIYRITIEAVAE